MSAKVEMVRRSDGVVIADSVVQEDQVAEFKNPNFLRVTVMGESLHLFKTSAGVFSWDTEDNPVRSVSLEQTQIPFGGLGLSVDERISFELLDNTPIEIGLVGPEFRALKSLGPIDEKMLVVLTGLPLTRKT